MQTDILKKKMEINTFLIISDDSVNENKGLLKNMQMFGRELKTQSRQ